MKRPLKRNKVTTVPIGVRTVREKVFLDPNRKVVGAIFLGLKSRLQLALSFILDSLRASHTSVHTLLPLTPSPFPPIFPLSTLLVLLLTSLFIPAHAFEKDFPPYPNGKFPPVCKIHSIKVASESDRNKGGFKSVYKDQDKSLKLELHLDMNYQKGSSGIYLRANDDAGKSLVNPIKVGWHPTDIDRVYWAYLNKDDRKDYIITVNGGDGYLSGGRQTATFLLSKKGTKEGFVTKSLGVYSLKQQDFYDYSTDNKCEFLHQSLIHDDENNYWNYNILQFLDDKIVLNNRLSRFFPKWIKLTADDNDKAALLSEAKKKQLSKKVIKQLGDALN